ATLYLGGVVLLEGWPVYRYIMEEMQGSGGSLTASLVGGVGGAMTLTAMAIWLPFRMGMRRVQAGDIHEM
ncbi:MAG TPA: hypothetical protein VLA43_06880, partial [Longimicrobiales bacterium]|nr:hypothetical protein [Longimicrobiales bacterium]